MKINLLLAILCKYTYQLNELKHLSRIMKTIITCMLVALFPIKAANVLSQNAVVSIPSQSLSVEELISLVENQTDYLFLYSEKEIDLARKVNVNAKATPVHEVLKQSFLNTNISYSFNEDYISLRKKADEGKLQDNRHIVTGTIVDDQGEPLVGVSVFEKGTTNGTITDLNGNYSLRVSDGKAIVVYSFIGYGTREVVVGNQTSLNIALKEDTQLLDEIVIVSYGTQKKRDLTGAVSTLNADDLSNLTVGQVGQKLQGQVAGVQAVQSSGMPGQGMAIKIRGASSINNSSQPLIVVDGMPISTGLNNINPDDIETFTVLKDAAASSLYGSRAANGVILITTKRAKKGRTEVSLNAYYGLQSIKGIGDFDMMNAREFAQYKKEWYEDRNLYEGYNTPVPEMYQNPEQYGEGTNWFDEVTRDAAIQNYTLNVSTSTEKVNSNISLGYFKQDGIVKNSGFERFTFRANNEYQVNEKIRLGLNVSPMVQNYTNSNTDGQRQILSASLSADPCASPYDENGDLTVAINSPGMFGQPNWIRYTKEVEKNYRIYTILANAFADVDIYNGLKYRFQVGTDIGSRRERKWVPSTSQGHWILAPPNKATSKHNSDQYYTWTIENLLTYEKQIGDHRFDLLAGYSAQKYSYETARMTGTDFADDDIPRIEAAATISEGKAKINEWALVSLIGRLNYSFKDRYYLQANVRRDGCSRFGADNRYATFPSVSAGWIASDEAFMEPLTDVMSYLKLKASYGVTGNYNIGDYDHWSTVKSEKGDNYVLGGALVPGKKIDAIGNNKLTWEETNQWDLGLEVGLLNDRIFFTYDYYERVTDGMLYQIDLPWSTGFDNIKANIGKFKSWGHEMSLTTRNLTGPFQWRSNLNLTIPRNKVLKLGPNDAPIGGVAVAEDWNRLEVGQPIGFIVGYVFDGVYMNQQEFDSQPKHATSVVGSARMKDTNNDGVIDIYDRVKIADPNPDILFGFTNNFYWNNFDLSIFLQGQIGGDVVAGIYENSWNLDGVFNVDKEVANRWRSEENPGNGKMPRTYGPSTELFRTYHTGMVYDASYLSIRNVTLGYDVPLKKNKYISKFRPYITVQNLAMIKSYPGSNPEASSSSGLSWKGLGIDRTNTPVPRTYTIGCNITF